MLLNTVVPVSMARVPSPTAGTSVSYYGSLEESPACGPGGQVGFRQEAGTIRRYRFALGRPKWPQLEVHCIKTLLEETPPTKPLHGS